MYYLSNVLGALSNFNAILMDLSLSLWKKHTKFTMIDIPIDPEFSDLQIPLL